MSLKLSHLILICLLSFNTFAGHIVPSTNRNRKTLDSGPLATSWQERTGVGLSGNVVKDGNSSQEEQQYSAYGFLNYNKFNVQANFIEESEERRFQLVDLDKTSISLLGGYQINDIYSFGVGFSSYSYEPSSLSNTYYDFGFSRKSSEGLFLGFGVVHAIEDNVFGQESDRNIYYAGVGKIWNNDASQFEILVDYDPDSYYAFTYSSISKYEIFELESEIYYKNFTESRVNSTSHYLLNAEFLITDYLYITPEYYYSTSTGSSWGPTFGFRNSSIDVDFSIEFLESDKEVYGINLAYLFN